MRITIIFLLFFPITLFAGSGGITNTYSQVDTLVATVINENYSAQMTSIDENDTRITAIQTTLPLMVIDGAGQEIGLLANIADDAATIDIYSSQGYLNLGISLATGSYLYINKLYFASIDCSGDGYSFNPNGTVFSGYNIDGSISINYIEKRSLVIENFQYESSSYDLGCNVANGTFPFVWLASLNDSGVTGVTSVSGETGMPIITNAFPITIERVQ